MKHIATFTLMIALGLAALAVQPGGDPMEAHAAAAFAGSGPGPGLESPCQSTSCLTGWQVAQERAINDADECRLVTSNQEEVGGCRAFVQAALQDRLENGW